MNTDINPPTPVTDLSAWGVTRRKLADLIGGTSRADQILDSHVVTWETDINANGVPVRRYVLRGEWEVDPRPPTYQPEVGDVVNYLTDEPVITRNGEIPRWAEWTVSSVVWQDRANPGSSLILIRQPHWGEGQGVDACINTSARMLKIVRRPR